MSDLCSHEFLFCLFSVLFVTLWLFQFQFFMTWNWAILISSQRTCCLWTLTAMLPTIQDWFVHYCLHYCALAAITWDVLCICSIKKKLINNRWSWGMVLDEGRWSHQTSRVNGIRYPWQPCERQLAGMVTLKKHWKLSFLPHTFHAKPEII